MMLLKGHIVAGQSVSICLGLWTHLKRPDCQALPRDSLSPRN